MKPMRPWDKFLYLGGCALMLATAIFALLWPDIFFYGSGKWSITNAILFLTGGAMCIGAIIRDMRHQRTQKNKIRQP